MVRFAAVAAALTLGALATPVQAGIYGDDLSRCLVKASSNEDQQAMLLWIYAAMSQHPVAQTYSKMTPAQEADISKRAAMLMQRLLTVDCRTETVAALRYEGLSTLETAFEVLGETGMRALMNDPQVAKVTSALTDYIDETKFESLSQMPPPVRVVEVTPKRPMV
jgi:hypothetical protein